jgi:hypothetical protein
MINAASKAGASELLGRRVGGKRKLKPGTVSESNEAKRPKEGEVRKRAAQSCLWFPESGEDRRRRLVSCCYIGVGATKLDDSTRACHKVVSCRPDLGSQTMKLSEY